MLLFPVSLLSSADSDVTKSKTQYKKHLLETLNKYDYYSTSDTENNFTIILIQLLPNSQVLRKAF